jgi:hypothetical protein
LFRNKENAKFMTWHKSDRKQDHMLRHPTDGSHWRKIDRKYKDFAREARNIRFGLSIDGFNPFGELAVVIELGLWHYACSTFLVGCA